MPTNFLLASSAIIPLLALTLIIELRHFELPHRLPWLAFVGFVLYMIVTVNGEWIGLGSLEKGHLASGLFGGGIDVVWTAMAALTLGIGGPTHRSDLRPALHDAVTAGRRTLRVAR